MCKQIINFLSPTYRKRKKQYNFYCKKFLNSQIDFNAILDKDTILEGKNIIHNHSDITHSFVGFASYVGSNCILYKCHIGRFCSISSNCKIEVSTHPITFVSTYPSFFNTNNDLLFGKGKTNFNEFLICSNNYIVNIGNDVWIGENVLIKGGITIGDGAIIGMGAVVTNDVPPYSIVGGVPAKVIKYRFDEETINKLLEIKWWNWNEEIINVRRDEFCNTKEFVNKYYIKNE